MSSNVTNPHNNGAVLNIAQLIKAVMSSAAEAEFGALYINTGKAVPMRKLLTKNGPHATTYSHSNQQQHIMQGHQQHYTTSENKSNGHEISLVTLP